MKSGFKGTFPLLATFLHIRSSSIIPLLWERPPLLYAIKLLYSLLKTSSWETWKTHYFCSLLLWHSSQWAMVVLTWGCSSLGGNFYSSSSLLGPASPVPACYTHVSCLLDVILSKPKGPLFLCDHFNNTSRLSFNTSEAVLENDKWYFFLFCLKPIDLQTFTLPC